MYKTLWKVDWLSICSEARELQFIAVVSGCFRELRTVLIIKANIIH